MSQVISAPGELGREYSDEMKKVCHNNYLHYQHSSPLPIINFKTVKATLKWNKDNMRN